MKTVVLTHLCLLFVVSAWSQRGFIDWGLKVNDRESDFILKSNFSNTIEFTGRDAAHIGMIANNAEVHKVGERFVVIPVDGEKDVMIHFVYQRRKKLSKLGVMVFRVE
jgi:hypothetical protein